MSLGISGPIGREMAMVYSLVATFARQGRLNKNTCGCKVCGRKIGPDQGVSYTIDDIAGPNLNHYYLCLDCDAWMAGKIQQWSDYTKRASRERAIREPAPSDEEIDRRIEEHAGKKKQQAGSKR